MEGNNGHFLPGEKVVYPQFGLGVVLEITHKEVEGGQESFYRLEFPVKQIEILVPVTRAEENGLRKIMTDDQVQEILAFMAEPKQCGRPQQWHRWRKQALEQLKTGDPLTIARIYCHLIGMEGSKGLSFTERKILTQVEQMLVAEIAAAKHIGEDKALLMLGPMRKRAGMETESRIPA
ncbi:MAG: hypothetical protein OEW39_06105 [Deltaproteobacteria bacterium]|nr:hypothetical protein [Deltaproteobacteria bacterium]